MRCAWLALAFCLPALVSRAQPVQAPRLEEFASSAPVVIAEQGDAYVVPLGPAVYRGVAEPELGDMRVFNGSGEAIAHGLRLAAPEVHARPRPFVSLPLFPLRAVEGEPGAALSVRLDGQGLQASLQLRADEAADAQLASARTYLVDARSLSGAPIARLRLEFEGSAELRSAVAVQASDDLALFRDVAGPHAVLRVNRAGQTLQRLDLELGGVRAKYLRVRLEQGAYVPLTGVTAQTSPDAVRRPMEAVDMVGRRRPDAPHIVDYEVVGPLPVRAVQVRFARDNTVVPVTLRRGLTLASASEELFRGTLYRVGEGARRVESPLLEVGLRREARAYQLEFPPAAPEAGAGPPPTLRLFFAPDELVFLPRGPGPYRLAYGHGRWRAAVMPAEAVLAPFSAVSGARVIRARLGLARREAGPQARVAPPQVSRPHLLLWAVLGLCVLLLLAMVVHLVRGARTKGEQGRQV